MEIFFASMYDQFDNVSQSSWLSYKNCILESAQTTNATRE